MWPDPNETQELLNRAGQDDPAAIDGLLGRHRESIRRLIEMRLDPALARRIDASDVVQEVLIRANRRLREYLAHPVLPFHLWLRQIAQDQIIDEHRRHRVAERRSIDKERALPAASASGTSVADLDGFLRDPALTPAAAALRVEFQKQLRGILDQLGEDDREIVMMRHFEQLSNREVAQALGISEPAAAMRHLRALRRLRALIEGNESPEASP